MKPGAVISEALVLGPRGSFELALRRVRKAAADIRDAIRAPFAPLTDAEWTRNRHFADRDAVDLFRDGGTSLGWAGARASASWRRRLHDRFPEHCDRVIAEADRTTSGHVVLFDQSVAVGRPGQEIDWHRDWFGTFSWPKDVAAADIALQPGIAAEPRVAWEFGRLLHLMPLGQAWQLTEEERYAECFAAYLESFSNSNPPGRSIQWASTMDVAIRASNILATWDLLRTSKAAGSCAELVLRLLVDHGRYIARHLENTDGLTSNHYLADLVGLAYLGQLGGIWPEARRWSRFAASGLQREIHRQVLSDGFSFESSVAYHRLVLEMLAYVSLVPSLRPRLSDDFWRRLRAMFQATRTYLGETEGAPQFGDNDGSHFHLLHRRHVLDHSYLRTLEAVIPDSSPPAASPEIAWTVGSETTTESSFTTSGVDVLPCAGIGVIHGPEVIVRMSCGPNGQRGRGGHAHNDRLGFTLRAFDDELIVDPGTYVYLRDPELRQSLRSTLSHATWMLADEEQNRFSRLSIFRLIPDVSHTNLRSFKGRARSILEGEHDGYVRRLGIRHLRRIRLDRTTGTRLIVLDVFRSTPRATLPAVTATLTIPLAPGVRVVDVSRHSWIGETAGGCRLKGSLWLRGIDGRWAAEDGWHSANFGTRARTSYLRFRGQLQQQSQRALSRLELCVSRV